MKHFITSILLSAIFAVTAFAQNTTEEEYNWMTKGYKTMVASGLDMKKGYYFDDAAEWYSAGGCDESYRFTYKLLRREKDKSIAGILIIAKSGYSGKSYYYCLPALDSNEEGDTFSLYMKSFHKSKWELDGAMTHCFFVSLAYYSSQLMTRYYSK